MDLARSRVASSVIQKNRVDEGEKDRDGRGAEKKEEGTKAKEEGGGCRGMRLRSRFIRASIPSLCQGICVFMWNTGESRRDREREKERE